MNPVAIIVPVIRRPAAAERFMSSLGNNAEYATVYAVAQEEDHETCKAWVEAGAQLIYAAHHGFPVKVNTGYRHTTEEYLLFVGDDVRFTDDAVWEAAHLLDSESDLDMVSTWDGFSTYERLAAIAPHPMVRREYISRWGMSWDGPGTVASPTYSHWGVDLEWSFIARARGVFEFCPTSAIEHLHPSFGRGKTDEIYSLGESTREADNMNFINRVMHWGPDSA